MNLLTFPVPLLHRAMRALHQHTENVVRWPVGVSRWGGHVELLAALPGSAVGQVLQLAWSNTLALPSEIPPDCAGILLLGQGAQRGRARGMVHLHGYSADSLDSLRLVGPGLPTIRLRKAVLPASLTCLTEAQDQTLERWSRTIGALGTEVWSRLVNVRYALIGLGRTGSRLALMLAHLGAGNLTLIDPDHLEEHNLGEMVGVTPDDLKRSKVEVLATAISRQTALSTALVTVPTSITRLPALHATQASDVLVTCVDHDSARLAASALATLFSKPLLDLATGVHGHGATRQMGADVRLVLPGRCLLCFGGLRDVMTARQVLASAEAEQTFYTRRDWQQERAGSLASLNQCAVGVALRLWEDFLAARIQESTWAHLEFAPTGHLTVTYPTVPAVDNHCPLCHLSSWGEEGVPHLRDLLRQDHVWRQGGTGETHPRHYRTSGTSESGPP